MIKYVYIILVAFSVYAHSACNIVNGETYGDCSGVNINKSPSKFISVSASESESGIIKGANIINGGTLYLSGISNGDITVSKGGKLFVTGIVKGTVINNGGLVEIEGDVSYLMAKSGKSKVSGIVSYASGNATVVYSSGAVIGGVPIK